MSPKFSGQLNCRWVDGKEWLMLSEWSYQDDQVGLITVPLLTIDGKQQGFVTDGASIPQAFWSIVGQPMRFLPAALIHDFLFCRQIFPREVVDGVFQRALIDMGAGTIRSRVMWAAVRAAGQPMWDARKPMDLAAPGDDYAQI